MSVKYVQRGRKKSTCWLYICCERSGIGEFLCISILQDIHAKNEVISKHCQCIRQRVIGRWIQYPCIVRKRINAYIFGFTVKSVKYLVSKKK